jgi:FtsH-binding integral membrane protein
MSGVSKAVQYAGLALYIVAEAIIFIPLIYAALSYAPEMLQSAGLVTASLVAGITAIAFFTKKDFSFLGRYLTIGGFVALGVISAGIIFEGFTLGI